MGTVADKMAKKILSSRGSRVVDLAAWRKGRKMALEAGFGDEGRLPGKFAGLDPCHAIYALAENVSSLMAESLSGMREAKGFVKIAGGAEDEYMPAVVTRRLQFIINRLEALTWNETRTVFPPGVGNDLPGRVL